MLTIKRIMAFVVLSTFFNTTTQATIVEFQTPLGNFQVNLYDETTPKTVANFLEYVDSANYNTTVFHRSVSDFVVQGGGFTYEGTFPPVAIETNDPVENEPVHSNVKGTIAMAKVSGNPDSATSQWFFNLADNSGGSASLDIQNEGFTVFGEVVGDGMDVVNAIADLQTFNFGGSFGSLPLRNYTSDDFAGDVDPVYDNFAMVTAIVIIDAASDTAADLDPPANTGGSDGDSSSSGGSIGVIGLLFLFGYRRMRASV